MQNQKGETVAIRNVAAIDIGSNAIRLVIAQIDADGAIHRLEDLQRSAPLGRESFSTGHITAETTNLAIEILRGFQTIMAPYNIDKLRAVTTTAVREAANQDMFLERIYMGTGLAVEVIAGSEADRLLYAAVREAFRKQNLTSKGTSLIMELGGGTAEISMYERDHVVFSGSYPLGTTRLHSALRAAHRSQSELVELINRYIGPAISVIQQSSPLDEVETVICVGGDMRFVANQLAPEAETDTLVRTFSRKDFVKFAKAIARLRVDQIVHKYILSYQDSEALVPALLTYAEVLRRTKAQTVYVPNVSMRDGMILDFVTEETGRGLDEMEEQIFSSAGFLGLHYDYDEDHAQHVADLSCQLFDLLGSTHMLGRRERRLLKVAALLHDVGNYISNRSHHKHSEYIIQASDIFGLRPQDKQIVSIVARYHRRALPKPTHLGFTTMSRTDRATISKLAAILRVADALDRSHSRKVKKINVDLRRNEIYLILGTREDLTLERLAMRTKGVLFEEVFGRKIVLQN